MDFVDHCTLTDAVALRSKTTATVKTFQFKDKVEATFLVFGWRQRGGRSISLPV